MCLANSSYLRDFFKLKKVPVYLNTTVKEITEKGVTVITPEGERFIECDTVITCVGYVAKPLAGSGKKVGDCNEAGNVMTAIHRAWDVAMKI